MNDGLPRSTSLLQTAAIFLSCLVCMAAAAAALTPVMGLAGMAASQIAFFLAVPLVMSLRWAGSPPADIAPVRLRSSNPLPAILLIPLSVAVAVYYEGFQETFVTSYQEELILKYREIFGIGETSPAVLYATVAVVPAVCEEFFFRGFLLGSLQRRMPAWAAICLSSVLFSLTHLPPAVMPPIFLLGILLGLMRHVTGSLAPPAAAHLLNNVIAVAYASGSLGSLGGLLEYGHLKFAASALGFSAVCAWALLAARRKGGEQKEPAPKRGNERF